MRYHPSSIEPSAPSSANGVEVSYYNRWNAKRPGPARSPASLRATPRRRLGFCFGRLLRPREDVLVVQAGEGAADEAEQVTRGNAGGLPSV